MASGKGSAKGVQLATGGVNIINNLPSSNKTIIIHRRTDNGFGFTLRHFVVYPPELVGLNSQDSVLNGIDHGETKRPTPIDTVFVRQVTPSGPADKAGLCSGDQIVSVNGNQVLNRTYSQVIELIQKSHDKVELGIIPKEDCVLEMVTPTSPTSPTVKSTPPPTKPKPVRSRADTSSPAKVTSTVTIGTTPSPDVHWTNSSVTLRLNDRSSEMSNQDEQPRVTRRGSIDRSAQHEHRNFVITSESNGEEDSNNNNRQKQPSSPGPHQVQSAMDGTFFFATTDYTGKPKALQFQRGAAIGDRLMVFEDSKAKGRSRSLPAVEMEAFRGWKENRKHPHSTLPSQNDSQRDQSSLQINIGERKKSDSVIPQFALSAPRSIASDSPSTVNISTNSEFSSRQPVAREPPHRRMSGEESTSYLIRTIASHMNQDRSPGSLKSSTMGATLLESEPDQRYNDEPQPAKIPRQAERSEQHSYSNQVSVYPNQTAEGVSVQFSNTPVTKSADFRLDTSMIDETDSSASPRQRRTSYLMATGSGPKSPPPKAWSSHGSVKKKKPTLSSALSSSFITPMMVHVSSGTEVCHDVSKEEFLENDEIFMEGDRDDDSMAPRLGRRVSYVMATSTPSSPTTFTMEGMREEEEEQTPGSSMEVSKQGLLWKKLAAAGGGKRSSVRSWKPVYAVLRGHIMYFHKDKESAHQGEGSEESQPISIKSSIVDIAYDYTKRKNVFRMTTFNGSEFLFQAEDHESMMTWIAAIQANNNPDEDVSGVTSQSVIIRKMRTVEQDTAGNSQTPPVHKLTPVTGAKMPNFSNLKKSLSFKNISGSQKGDSKNHQWGHKGHKKRKKQPPPASNYTLGFSIGVPLEMCPCSTNNKFVPILVEHCCEVVEKRGIDTVGVYRVPGNSAAVNTLQEELNDKGADNINFQDEKWHDVNNITSLLKQFLRKLPEGLVTAELYDGFVEANRKEDPVERMGALKMLINELPDHNYETLRYLLCHLKNVAENVDMNKMEARNLAIVFGPTLVRTGEDTMMSMVKDMSDQCRIVETILNHNEWFFESSEGDEMPPSKPPMNMDSPQEQFVSQSVLSSLGQAAGNFNEDGNMKNKPLSPSHLTLHIPKFRTKHTKSESHDGSPVEGLPPDGSTSPSNERGRPILKITSAGSCPGSPTQERSTKMLVAKRGGELASSSTGSMSEMMESDSRTRGTSSLKAYSYARPPPPSYRKTGSTKRPNSPPMEQQEPMLVNATFGFAPDTESTEPPRLDGDHQAETEHGQGTKPSFASLSEETRLRLLKVSLQQKAAEKKRTILESPTSPTPPAFPDVNGDLPTDTLTIPHRLHDLDTASDSTEHLSSTSTSRSSSTPSSKNASRESLPQQNEQDTRKNSSVAMKAAASSKNTPRESPSQQHEPDTRRRGSSVAMKAAAWERNCAASRATTPATSTPATSTPATSTHVITSHTTTPLTSLTATSHTSRDGSSDKVQSSETVLNIVQGKGVPMAAATRRPASSDIRARRNTMEGLRLQPSMQSESSSSSSDEEDDLKLSMSKTFDEKLRILLDLDYQFKGQKKEEEEAASVVSSYARSSTESLDDMRSSNTSITSSASDRRPSFERATAEPRRASVERSLFIIPNKQAGSPNTKTTIQIKHNDRRGSSSAGRVQSNMTDKRPVSDRDVKTELKIDKTTGSKKSDGLYPTDHQRVAAQSRIGHVHTTTPVALKEFKVGQTNLKKDPSTKRPSGKTPASKPTLTRHDSPYVKTKTESTFIQPRTETSSILISPRNSISSPRGSISSPRGSISSPRGSISSPRGSISDSSPRNSSAESSPRNSRTEMNINISSSGPQKSSAVSTANTGSRKPTTGKYAAMAARSHVPPKVMGRETTTKSKTYPYRDTHRDILPSRSTYGNRPAPPKEPVRQKHVHKMESNAKHIAELLEEMHSERYLKMSRQRSDISGQAQRNAAQRAAQSRMRRHSLGDENKEQISMTVSTGHEKGRIEDRSPNLPQGSRDSVQRKASDEKGRIEDRSPNLPQGSRDSVQRKASGERVDNRRMGTNDKRTKVKSKR